MDEPAQTPHPAQDRRDPITLERAKEDLGVVKHKVRHIEFTPWRDIPDLFEQLSDGTPTSAAIRFAMLTLVRSAGVRAAQFSEIDGDKWKVPAMRMKGRDSDVQDFRVPLTQPALEAAQPSAAIGCGAASRFCADRPPSRVYAAPVQSKRPSIGQVAAPPPVRANFRRSAEILTHSNSHTAEILLK